MSTEEYVDRLKHAASLDDVRDAAKSFCNTVGFQIYTITAALPDSHGSFAFVTLAQLPSGYEDQFVNKDSYVGVDPVMQALKQQSAPVVWGQRNYVEVGQGENWERIAALGMGQGVGLGVHLRRDRHLVVGFDNPPDVVTTESDLRMQVQALQTFSVNLLEVAQDLLFPAAIAAVSGAEQSMYVVKQRDFVWHGPRLTNREREVLQWASVGKTAWEASQILGLSERTVEKHISSAITKLECSTRGHAIAKALQLGVIS